MYSTISNKTADSFDRPQTIKLTDKDHTDCCPQMNASYVRNNYLYWSISLLNNTNYLQARKRNYINYISIQDEHAGRFFAI